MISTTQPRNDECCEDGPWTLVFHDERDFCGHASKIIGAVYVVGKDAAARIARSGSFGTTFGKVGATGSEPLDAEAIASQYMVKLALAEYRDDPTPEMAEQVVRRVLEAKKSSAPPRSWPRDTSVGRVGDMAPSQDTHMRVVLDGDNDACVEIWDNTKGRAARASIEFCAGGAGGGKSPHTRAALIQLMVAMEADDVESPRGSFPPKETS